MPDPAPVPASEALSSPPDLPTPTPGVAPPAPAEPASTPPAPDPAAPAAPDGWDPKVHENPPKRNLDGSWRKLRGNGARKVAGLPMIGAMAGAMPKPAPSSAAPAPPASPSVLVVPDSTPGAAGATVDAEPAPLDGQPAAGLAIDAYDGTAAALTGGQFGILSMFLGKAWNASPQETQAWKDAWRRVFHHYQWRPLGPLLEIVMLAFTSGAKRRDDPETREKVGGMLSWFRRRKPADAPPPPPPPEPRDAEPPADPATVPAHRLKGWV